MENIAITNEESKSLYAKYLHDYQLVALRNEIKKLYSIAAPKGIIMGNGSFEIIYDEKTVHLTNKIQAIIDDIVKTDYINLITKNHD